MSREIDKSDVDISQLFKWSTEVELADPKMDLHTKVYVRLVGDADLNRARAYALRRSAEMRKNLNTKGTDEYIAFVNEVEDFEDKDTMATMVILLMLSDIQQEALRTVEVPEPKTLKSTATLEEQEQYQTEVDEYPNIFREAIEKELEKIRKREEKRLKKLDEDALYKEYKGRLIDNLCSDEMNDSFYDMCVYYGTYKTDTFEKQAFVSFDAYRNSSGLIKETLKEAYKNLELGMGTLKKSPEATQ